jgi:hypothetical protein
MRSAPLLLCYRRWFKAQNKGDVAFRFKHVLPEDRRDDSSRRSSRKSSKKRGLDASEDEETSNEKILLGKKRIKVSTAEKKVEEPMSEPDAMSPESKMADRILTAAEKTPNPSLSPLDSVPANMDLLSGDKPPVTVEKEDHVAPLGPERLALISSCLFP